MNLVIDWGNTHCKWAVFNDSNLVTTHTEVALNFSGLKEYIQTHANVEYAMLSSVVNMDKQSKNFLQNNFKVFEISANTKLPIRNQYKTPQTLGNDRLASAVGAASIYPKHNVLVIDAGTCIKFDFVNADGSYLGGSISPGLRMRLKALHDYTQKLPLIELLPYSELIGSSTQESILSGVLNGCLAEVDGIIDLYKKQYTSLTVVLTGGDRIYFEKKLKNSIFAAPHVIFVGLNEILSCNV